MDLIQNFAALAEQAAQILTTVRDLPDLEEVQIDFLGRKGRLAAAMAGMKVVSAEDRPRVGVAANEAKQKIQNLIDEAHARLEKAAFATLAETEWIDVTEPGKNTARGSLHITTQTINEITSLFERVGFTRVRHPEIDWDWFAFEALNMPPTHPARDEWETFFVDTPHDEKKGKLVLTPHTSNGQIHEMQKHRPPIRMINIGKCYRRQSDITHVPMFHQFEGLVVDRGISVANLKGTLEYFAREFFGHDRKIRLRPYHFRFTEPSFEIDVSCGLCHGTGSSGDGKCRVCKQGWLELGGAGMVHPHVFKACGIDADEYTGFAFGWGVERSFMMKSGVNLPDLRELYKNDLRFLKQF